MFGVLKGEFSRHNFGLSFHKPEAFCEAQWRWPKWVFVLFRLLMATYCIFAFIFVIVKARGRHNVMVYLTIWTFITETLFFTLGAVLAVTQALCPRLLATAGRGCSNEPVAYNNFACMVDSAQPKPEGLPIPKSQSADGKFSSSAEVPAESPNGEGTRNVEGGREGGREGSACSTGMPWYVKVYWVISNITQVFPIIVTIIYFTALFKGKVLWHDMNVHAINTVMLVLDLCVCARPVRLLHIIHPVAYGLTYVVFNTIYWATDRENNVLYQYVLDWNHPGITAGVIVGLALVIIPIFQVVNFAIHKLKLYIYYKVYGEKYC